jgi:hypothetical protein
MGTDGFFGGVERLDFVWPYHGFSFRYNPESMSASLTIKLV